MSRTGCLPDDRSEAVTFDKTVDATRTRDGSRAQDVDGPTHHVRRAKSKIKRPPRLAALEDAVVPERREVRRHQPHELRCATLGSSDERGRLPAEAALEAEPDLADAAGALFQ